MFECVSHLFGILFFLVFRGVLWPGLSRVWRTFNSLDAAGGKKRNGHVEVSTPFLGANNFFIRTIVCCLLALKSWLLIDDKIEVAMIFSSQWK